MRDQRGFTLIEMMIVVAVIAVLAVIAVPAFFSQSRKGKASSETSAMFAELSTKEEQYKIENGSYLAGSACPATPSSSLQSLSGCTGSGTPWATMHVNPPETKAYCSYTITVGAAGVAPTGLPTGVTMASDGTTPTPITPWYFIFATCDMDGSSAKNSTYFMSSIDTKIQTVNEGF